MIWHLSAQPVPQVTLSEVMRKICLMTDRAQYLSDCRMRLGMGPRLVVDADEELTSDDRHHIRRLASHDEREKVGREAPEVLRALNQDSGKG